MKQVVTSTDPSLGKARDFDLLDDETWVGIFERDGGMHVVFSSGHVLPLKRTFRFPIIRFLGPDRVVALDRSGSSGEPSALLLAPDRDEQASFHPGSDIADVVPLRDLIAITYGDEGVYRYPPPSCHGLAFFDLDGEFVAGYGDLVGPTAVRIDDCECACRVDPDSLAFVPYMDCPIVQLDPRSRAHRVLPLPDFMHNTHALSVRGDRFYVFQRFHSRLSILSWRPGTDPREVGHHPGPLRGLEGGRFLSVAENGFNVLTCAESD